MFLALLSQLIKNPTFRVGQNWVSNSWEIADIEFVVVGGGMVKVVGMQSHFMLGLIEKIEFGIFGSVYLVLYILNTLLKRFNFVHLG